MTEAMPRGSGDGIEGHLHKDLLSKRMANIMESQHKLVVATTAFIAAAVIIMIAVPIIVPIVLPNLTASFVKFYYATAPVISSISKTNVQNVELEYGISTSQMWESKRILVQSVSIVFSLIFLYMTPFFSKTFKIDSGKKVPMLGALLVTLLYSIYMLYLDGNFSISNRDFEFEDLDKLGLFGYYFFGISIPLLLPIIILLRSQKNKPTN